MSDTETFLHQCRFCGWPTADEGLDRNGLCVTCTDYAYKLEDMIATEKNNPTVYPTETLPDGRVLRLKNRDWEKYYTGKREAIIMTEQKRGARLGHDPLSDGPKGIDGLIRPTTPEAQEEQSTHTTHKTPGKKGERGDPLPRINMAFDPDHLDYLRSMAGLENISITRYIYNLVSADREARRELYDKIRALKEGKA